MSRNIRGRPSALGRFFKPLQNIIRLQPRRTGLDNLGSPSSPYESTHGQSGKRQTFKAELPHTGYRG